MTLNFWFSCLHLPSAGITGLSWHLYLYTVLEMELEASWINTRQELYQWATSSGPSMPFKRFIHIHIPMAIGSIRFSEVMLDSTPRVIYRTVILLCLKHWKYLPVLYSILSDLFSRLMEWTYIVTRHSQTGGQRIKASHAPISPAKWLHLLWMLATAP